MECDDNSISIELLRKIEEENELDLSGQKLESFPVKILSICKSKCTGSINQGHLQFTTLLVVDLSHNQLITFPAEEVAKNLFSLTNLNLSHNHLNSLENDILPLSTLPILRILDFSKNEAVRLISNRVYLLECMFKQGYENKALLQTVLKICSEDAIISIKNTSMSLNDEVLISLNVDNVTKLSLKKQHRLSITPRKEGFPMLQKLNGNWVTKDDINRVQQELTRSIRYPKNKALIFKIFSRKAYKYSDDRPKFRRNSRRHDQDFGVEENKDNSMIQKISISIDDNIDTEENDDSESDTYEEMTPKDWVEFHRLAVDKTMTKLKVLTKQKSIVEAPQAAEIDLSTKLLGELDDFYQLTSSQVSKLRKKINGSRSVSEPIFKDDMFLDCLAQMQQSRLLRKNAMEAHQIFKDDRCIRRHSSNNILQKKVKSMHEGISPELIDKKCSNSPENSFEISSKFCSKGSKATCPDIKPDMRHYLQHEQMEMRDNNNKLLRSHSCREILSRNSPVNNISESIDTSLSNLHLKNAVDFHPKPLSSKHEARHIQTLIESDQRLLEERLVRDKHQEHVRNLRAIADGKLKNSGKKKDICLYKISAWQRRNLIAEREREKKEKPIKKKARGIRDSNFTRKKVLKGSDDRFILPYQSVKPLEEVAMDTLPEVTSSELLLRCADIRKNSRESLKLLSKSKHDFVQRELYFSNHRNNMLNILKQRMNREDEERHSKELFVDEEEIVYSDLFLN